MRILGGKKLRSFDDGYGFSFLARSQLCAASLSQRNLIVAVGGVSETASTPSTQPFKTPIPNTIECAELSPSGEAYDPRCAHWIRLPELLNRGPLIGAALVPLSSSSGGLFPISVAVTNMFSLNL